MQISLADQVAWVTGGSEGIGRAIASHLANCGAKVAISARDEEPLHELASEIRQRGGDALAVPADVADPDAMHAAVRMVVDRWRRLTFVCANAGVNGTWAPIDELTCDDWSSTIAVNLTGAYLTAHVAVPHLRNAGGGSMVIVSSVNGTSIFSNAGATAYAASKAGQLALGKMLALELAPARIRVNVVCPGAFATGIHDKTNKKDLDRIETPVEYPHGSIPLTHGAMGDPCEVAHLVAFLASSASRHITGTPIWIDGGQSLL